MTTLITRVTTGDKFIWHRPNGPDTPVYVEVTRVARDGSWADIHCSTWCSFWTKRQRMPLPAGCRPFRWTSKDLDREAGTIANQDGAR